jgi:hypothetical protein
MPDIRPTTETTARPDDEDTTTRGGAVPEEGIRRMPTDPPDVVPGAASEQPVVAAGTGLAGFAKADPEGGLAGTEDDTWVVDPTGTVRLPEDE